MKLHSPQRCLAFTLAEVTLSIGIVAFCLINLLGLIPVGVTSNQTCTEQTAAAWIATSIVEDLQVTSRTHPASNQTSPQFRLVIPATGDETQTLFLGQDGRAAGGINANADPSQNPRFRATLYFSGGDSSMPQQRGATSARILITWPALADGEAGSAPEKYSGSYETWISLNRR